MSPDTPQPQAARVVAHLWNGSVDGHNCQDCAWDSIWRCDPTAHLLPFTPTIGVRLRSDAAPVQPGTANHSDSKQEAVVTPGDVRYEDDHWQRWTGEEWEAIGYPPRSARTAGLRESGLPDVDGGLLPGLRGGVVEGMALGVGQEQREPVGAALVGGQGWASGAGHEPRVEISDVLDKSSYEAHTKSMTTNDERRYEAASMGLVNAWRVAEDKDVPAWLDKPGNRKDVARFSALKPLEQNRVRALAWTRYDGTRTVSRCWDEALEHVEANPR